MQRQKATLSIVQSDLSNVLASVQNLDANQTNGTQKSQIVDGSGNVIGSTGNALDVKPQDSDYGRCWSVRGQ
jgi:hypothetical protein